MGNSCAFPRVCPCLCADRGGVPHADESVDALPVGDDLTRAGYSRARVYHRIRSWPPARSCVGLSQAKSDRRFCTSLGGFRLRTSALTYRDRSLLLLRRLTSES